MKNKILQFIIEYIALVISTSFMATLFCLSIYKSSDKSFLDFFLFCIPYFALIWAIFCLLRLIKHNKKDKFGK